MSKLYSALLLCEKHSKTIAIIGQSLTSDCQRGGGGVFRDLSLINHPCYLGYKGEVGYIETIAMYICLYVLHTIIIIILLA